MKINKQAKREAKQLFRYCLVNDILDENRVRNVVQHVVAAGRRDCPAILSHFRRLVKLDLARHTATVESAAPHRILAWSSGSGEAGKLTGSERPGHPGSSRALLRRVG